MPSKERPPCTDLQRAPLLAAQVEILLAAQRIDEARPASEELGVVAQRYRSRPLLAGAALARGRIRVAAGDVEAARTDLKHAVEAFHDLAMPYESAKARAALAQCYEAAGDRHLASLESDAVADLLRRVGATGVDLLQGTGRGGAGAPARTAMGSPPTPEEQPETGATAALRCEGDHWVFAFHGDELRLRDLKGLRYLARLLAEPGREFHVLDLVAAESGAPAEVSDVAAPGLDEGFDPGTGPLLDAQAKATYRRRLAEIEDDLAEARDQGEDDRAAAAELERDFLVRELARAVGLSDRDRLSGVAAERARVSVTRALRYTLARIREHHGQLGDHLEHAVCTGTYATYAPDPASPVVWEVRPQRATSMSLRTAPPAPPSAGLVTER